MEPVVVVFAGDYNVNCKVRLHRELSRLATKPRLVLDLTEVAYMDSTCITELMRMEQRRTAAGFESTVLVTQAPVLQRIFAVLTLDKIFRIVPTIESAVGNDVEGLHVEYAFCGEDGSTGVPRDFDRKATG